MSFGVAARAGVFAAGNTAVALNAAAPARKLLREALGWQAQPNDHLPD